MYIYIFFHVKIRKEFYTFYSPFVLGLFKEWQNSGCSKDGFDEIGDDLYEMVMKDYSEVDFLDLNMLLKS